MASYGNTKLPSNLDKPPLFHAAYRTGGSETHKPVNVDSFLHASGAVGLGAQVRDFKVPKLENELFFTSGLDHPPSFKRAKFADESPHPQIHLLQHGHFPVLPLFSDLKSTPIVEDEDDHICDEDLPSTTGTECIKIESHFNPLNEPSPLGLNLRKSPSLLDLIQRKLAQTEDDGFDQGGNLSRLGSLASSAEKDKLKAANFAASKLRIGEWECTSRYDGDLVAKCYYAKRKLVWEVLDSGLKSKMEVQWSDISALKASFPDDQPAVLNIELSRPPLFFKELNPQPRKHTLWHTTSDFTDGKASLCRHHSVQFPVGVLNRHFEKLLQCDARLKALNEQTRSIQDSYFFDNRGMQIDRQHLLNYQTVISDCAVLQPLAMGGMSDEALLPTICVVDCSQIHQGFQNEPLQHLLPHHAIVENRNGSRLEGIRSEPSQRATSVPMEVLDNGIVENRNGVRLEGVRSEPLQRATSVPSEVSPGAGVHHHQGGFHMQFATAASPSSVIDTRVLNECSSSSETTEEAPLKDTGRSEVHNELSNLHMTQESSKQFPTFKSGSRQLNEWSSCPSTMAWSADSVVLTSMDHTSQKQALNELYLDLLGEPFASSDLCQYPLSTASGRVVQEMLMSSGSSPTVVDRNLGALHRQGHLAMGDSRMWAKVYDNQWNMVLDHRALEAGSSSLPSHGSYVDLVYLPRIASQPQFLKPGP